MADPTMEEMVAAVTDLGNLRDPKNVRSAYCRQLSCVADRGRPGGFRSQFVLGGIALQEVSGILGSSSPYGGPIEYFTLAASTYPRTELESLKAFLSRTDDGSIRLAWRRNPETMLRQRFENSGTFLNEATRTLILIVAVDKTLMQPEYGDIVTRISARRSISGFHAC